MKPERDAPMNVIDYFAISWRFHDCEAVGAHLLPHYRLRGENMLSTAVAKLNDGVTVHWGVEDISLVVERNVRQPVISMANVYTSHEEEMRGQNLSLSEDVYWEIGYFSNK